MTAVKRRINSTGRKRIKRERVDVRLVDTKPGEPLKAQLSIDLSDEGFPEQARLAVEAYHRSSGMRFDCGTVGNPKIPPVLVLDQIDRSASVLFRIKIVDTGESVGRLLGAAERIQPRSDDGEQGRRSIFPIRTQDLGGEVWKVEVDSETAPALLLNSRVPGLLQNLLETPLLQGALLPAALQIVLTELVRDPAADEEDDSEWKSDWLAYCRDQLGMSEDPGELTQEDDRAEWVNEAVRRFCANVDFIGQIRKRTEEAAQ